MIRIGFGVFALVCLAACSSSKDDGSTLQSLDNFAAGSRVRTNDCAGDPQLADHPGLKVATSALKKHVKWDTKSAQKEELWEVVAKGFAAIPPDYQRTFLSLGGQVVITDRANEMCTAFERSVADQAYRSFKAQEVKALQEGLNVVGSCYHFVPPSVRKQITGDEGQAILLILSADVGEIRHSFVRSFGYLTAQLYSHLIFTKEDKRTVWTSEENPKFRAQKQKLADAFLIDVAQTDHATRFRQYASGSASEARTRAFQDFVYAEAFDSFYCNAYADGEKNTRDIMQREFPETYVAFILRDSAEDQAAALTAAYGLNSRGTGSASNLSDAKYTVGLADSISKIRPSYSASEYLYSYNWYQAATPPKELGTAAAGEGFGLSGWYDWVDGTAVGEVWEGSKIMYQDYYDRTYEKTTRIYDQVQQGRGTSEPLGVIDTTSVVLNGAADGLEKAPGKAGGVFSAANNFKRAASGGDFDAEGNFVELSNSQRWNAGVNGVIGTSDVTGATGALTDQAMGMGGAIKRQGQGMGGVVGSTLDYAGQGLQRANIVRNEFGQIMKSNPVTSTISPIYGIAGGPSLPGYVSGAVKSANNTFTDPY